MSRDSSKTLRDLSLINFDARAFQKGSDGSYVLRPSVNFPISSINIEWEETYYPEEIDPSFPWPAYVSFKSMSNDIATNQDYLKMYRAFF